jgi:hypothetical protein
VTWSVDRRNQIIVTSCHLVRPHQISHLYTNVRIGCQRNNSRNFTKQMDLLIGSIPGIFFIFAFFCIINFIITIFLSLFLFLYFNSFSCSISHCFPPNHSFCPLSSTPFHCPHLSLLSWLNLSPHYSTLLHTHHLLNTLLFQLYTTPALCNPWQKHPAIQQHKFTEHTRATKPSNSHTSSPHTPLFHFPTFHATFTNYTRIHI